MENGSSIYSSTQSGTNVDSIAASHAAVGLAKDGLSKDGLAKEARPKITRRALTVRKRLPFRLEEDEFNEVCSEDDRQLLCFELNCALQHYIENERAVFLEGFGIISPRIDTAQKTHHFDRWGLLREETFRSVDFEKCEDVVALPRGRFPRLVESVELVARILPRLPVSWHVRWSERDIRVLIRSYIYLIRNRVVRNGVSHDLRSLGTLFALHNRQGEKAADWYAGADILIQPRTLPTLSITSSTLFERPILESAWELMEAALGRALLKTDLDVRKLLEPMGGVPTEVSSTLSSESEYTVSVSVFYRELAKDKANNAKGSLIYCTNGLQELTKAKNNLGSELVFQIPLHEVPKGKAPNGQSEVPKWPMQAIAMGWLLLQSTRTKTLRVGAGLSADGALDGSGASKIQSIVTTALDFLPAENLTARGPFQFINLVGVTDDEAHMVRGTRRSYLLSLLKLKNLDQLTLVGRNSLLIKTHIE